MAGKYTQIRVYMYVDDEENENHPVEVTYHEDVDGEAGDTDPVPAKLPSGTLKFVRPFVVEENGETSITLDFDLVKSVVFTGSKKACTRCGLYHPVSGLRPTDVVGFE